MRGYLETLTMPELTLDEPTRARYLTIISDETNRLERLIGELLDLARLEGGGGSLQTARVPIAGSSDRVAARHERALQSAGVTLQAASIPPRRDVDRRPRSAGSRRCRTSRPTRSATRRRAARCGLQSRAAGGVVCRSKTRRGRASPAEHLPHIFDRFYKADASRPGSRRKRAGFVDCEGDRVERHGGTISVTSRPGRTVFEMVLPRSRADARVQVPGTRSASASPSLSSFRSGGVCACAPRGGFRRGPDLLADPRPAAAGGR
jgi:two-component system sensor histidine kinase BaeS